MCPEGLPVSFSEPDPHIEIPYFSPIIVSLYFLPSALCPSPFRVTNIQGLCLARQQHPGKILKTPPSISYTLHLTHPAELGKTSKIRSTQLQGH